MEEKKKYIVVHSGARDLYEVAIALHKVGKLGYLVTDDYFFRKEFRTVLPHDKVKIPVLSFVMCVLCHLFHKSWLYNINDGLLGKFAGRLSNKIQMSLLSYSEYAYWAFKKSDVHPKILFQFHPCAATNKRIFDAEITKHPEIAKSLKTEKEYNLTENQRKRLNCEVSMADYYIGASSFTVESLVDNSAPPFDVILLHMESA